MFESFVYNLKDIQMTRKRKLMLPHHKNAISNQIGGTWNKKNTYKNYYFP